MTADMNVSIRTTTQASVLGCNALNGATRITHTDGVDGGEGVAENTAANSATSTCDSSASSAAADTPASHVHGHHGGLTQTDTRHRHAHRRHTPATTLTAVDADELNPPYRQGRTRKRHTGPSAVGGGRGSVDPSIVAVHGSVPSSPVLRGRRPLPRRDSWDVNAGLGVIPDRLPQGLTLALDTAVPEADEAGHGFSIDVGDGPMVTTLPEGVDPSAPVVKRPNYRVIGIDFDDVMTQNVKAMVEKHNELYGTDMTLEDMETYIYFQNRGWGEPAETSRKLRMLDEVTPTMPCVPGFAEALRILHGLGHPIHIVTSRAERNRDAVIEWLAKYGITVGFRDDDVIAAVWFTDTYSTPIHVPDTKGDTASAIAMEEDVNERLREAYRTGPGAGKGGTGKLKVLRAINAALFIDDHHGNLVPIVKAEPAIPCLLFGPYPWNRSNSGLSSPVELMSWEERQRAGVTIQKTAIELSDHLHRTETWEDVIRWVKAWDDKDT